MILQQMLKSFKAIVAKGHTYYHLKFHVIEINNAAVVVDASICRGHDFWQNRAGNFSIFQLVRDSKILTRQDIFDI